MKPANSIDVLTCSKEESASGDRETDRLTDITSHTTPARRGDFVISSCQLPIAFLPRRWRFAAGLICSRRAGVQLKKQKKCLSNCFLADGAL